MRPSQLSIFSIIILILLLGTEFVFMKFHLFDYMPHIGIMLHLLGGCFSGLLLYGLSMESLTKIPILLQLIFVLGVVAIAAVCWEGFEWVVGAIFNKKMQGSINNIMLDLFIGMMGGFLACLGVYVNYRKKPKA